MNQNPAALSLPCLSLGGPKDPIWAFLPLAPWHCSDKGWFKWEAKTDIFFTKCVSLADSFGSSPRCSGQWQKDPRGRRATKRPRWGPALACLSVWLVNPLSVGLSFWFGRFDTWLSSRLKLPPSYLLSYSGNYTDDAKSWRLVDITRLTSKYQHDRADKRICTSLLKTKTCSLERALRRTHRFQKWLRAKRLTPDLVQVRAPQHSPLCPTMAGGSGERDPQGGGAMWFGAEGVKGRRHGCDLPGGGRVWAMAGSVPPALAGGEGAAPSSSHPSPLTMRKRQNEAPMGNRAPEARGQQP